MPTREESARTPCGGKLPLSANLIVDELVVVLKSGADAFLRKCRPYDALEDTLAVVRPDWELISVNGVGFLHALDVGLISEVQDSAVSRLCVQRC